MNFNSEKPIYLQIADHISERILSGEIRPEERIPSVRQYSGDAKMKNSCMRQIFRWQRSRKT